MTSVETDGEAVAGRADATVGRTVTPGVVGDVALPSPPTCGAVTLRATVTVAVVPLLPPGAVCVAVVASVVRVVAVVVAVAVPCGRLGRSSS